MRRTPPTSLVLCGPPTGLTIQLKPRTKTRSYLTFRKAQPWEFFKAAFVEGMGGGLEGRGVFVMQGRGGFVVEVEGPWGLRCWS